MRRKPISEMLVNQIVLPETDPDAPDVIRVRAESLLTIRSNSEFLAADSDDKSEIATSRLALDATRRANNKIEDLLFGDARLALYRLMDRIDLYCNSRDDDPDLVDFHCDVDRLLVDLLNELR